VAVPERGAQAAVALGPLLLGSDVLCSRWGKETACRLKEFRAVWPQLWTCETSGLRAEGNGPLEARCQFIHSREGQGPHWLGVGNSKCLPWADGHGTGFSSLCFISADSF